jgi:hypothetical protein
MFWRGPEVSPELFQVKKEKHPLRIGKAGQPNCLDSQEEYALSISVFIASSRFVLVGLEPKH